MQIKKLLSKTELITLSKTTELWVLLVLVLLATATLLYATSGGLIWTSDSHNYWAASRSFNAHGKFVAVDGGTYIFWPPLFPIILSFFATASGYYLLHISIFVASLISCYAVFKLLTKRIPLSLILLLFYIISVYPYLSASFFWSENIFTLLLYLFIYLYLKSKERRKNIWLFVAAMLVASLMCLQRNVGIFIMIGVSLYELILFLRMKTSLKAFFIVAIAIFLTVLPNLLWNFNSLSLQGEAQEMVSSAYFQHLI